MRNRQRQRTPAVFPESMLDLIWILLFFFLMISTVRTEKERQTVLVERVPYRGGSAAHDVRRRTKAAISITASGVCRLDGEEIEIADLEAALQGLRRRIGPDLLLLIDVDRDARVDTLLRVEDVAREAQIEYLLRRARQKPPTRR